MFSDVTRAIYLVVSRKSLDAFILRQSLLTNSETLNFEYVLFCCLWLNDYDLYFDVLLIGLVTSYPSTTS